MRNEMNVSVEAVQAMNGAAKRCEKATVKLPPPVRRNDDVRGALHGEPVSEVIDFGVRDVPALSHA